MGLALQLPMNSNQKIWMMMEGLKVPVVIHPSHYDTLADTVSNKKPVVVPSTMFEYIGPVTGKDMSHFKCLLGCLPSYNTNGSPKYISCSNYSRFNIRRHVKLKHMASLNQFDNETTNLHGYATENEHQSELDDDGRPKSTSSDTSIPLEDDTLGDTVSNKKPVVVPSTMFEYIGPVTGTDMSHFKCLMGCLPTYNTNGSPKYISCSNNSRFNIRRHVKSKHEAKLKQFDNETKNLHGEPTKKRSKSSSQNLKQNCQKNNDISSKTVSCQTEFGDLGSNDTTTNPLKDKDHSTKSIGFKKPIKVPRTMFQYIGPGKGTEMSLFKCLLGCVPMYNSNGTEKYISCANSSRFNLRRHVKFKHKSKLHLFNEKSKRQRSLKEDLPDKQSESTRFQLRPILNQQENPLRDKTVGETPHKSLSITEDSASSANSLVETARDKNLSVIESSPLPFVDVTDFLQMTLDVRPSSARGGNVPSCPSQQEAVDQSDSALENLSISSNLVRRMYSSSSSSKEKSTGTIANKDSSIVSRLSRSLSTPENENTLQSCQEAKQTDSPSSVDIDYLHFPRAITVDPVFQDDIDEPDPIVNTPTALFRHSSRSSQAITKQAITTKELSKTVEGRSIKDGAQLNPHLIKPSALPLKELKLSPNESTAFQDLFGNHVYWLQLIKRPRLVGNSVLWNDVYQELQPTRIDTVPGKCEIKFRTFLHGNVITKYYKPVKLSQKANDAIDNYPFAAWTPLITVSSETIHVLKLARITGIDDPMLPLIPELIIS
ncbi:uncharacterized protein LOC124209262 isoform X2 [Daphnia pulex]|uniref:uncharacterized protein LOC124209262 isoform X2 n=1 Tax=Daphnia pulex TaxID=6669 RepID=UPI001EDD04B6|nr:uncharacterized protein LOC124209262 isoform X2 [Daphnia pulex]